MPNLKLPPRGSKEAERVISRIKNGELETVCRELGYANKESFLAGLRRSYDFRVSQQAIKQVEQPALPQPEPYPDFKIKPYIVGKQRRDKEDIVIVRADAHTGKKTETYNLKIYRKRVDYLLSKVMRIIELHRPIAKAHIFYVGDCVQGENIYQGSNVSETECGVWEQINDEAIPVEVRFNLSIAQMVESVESHCVWGNHGRYSQEATPRANWDNFFYKNLANAVSNQKNIKVNVPTQFYQVVDIYGFRFFLFHGHQVKASSGLPLFALKRKLQEWFAYVKGFHYAYGGHFHTWGADTINSIADYQLCPPLVTGDEWALQVVGRASKPIQLCFGVHLKQGRSWEYKLYTDDEYLPEPEV